MNNNESLSLLKRAETIFTKMPFVKLLLLIIPISMILTFVYLFSQDVYSTIMYTLNH